MELRKEEIEMHAVCSDGGPAYNILNKERIKTVIIPTRFHTYPQWNDLQNCILFFPRLVKHLIVNHKAYRKICSLCEQYHYDIIHTNVSVVNVGEKAAKKYGIQHIYHIREYQDLDFGMKMMPTRTRYVNYLRQCQSICITKGIFHHYGLSDSKSIVIYNGIKSQKDICYEDRKDNYFLFVGRVDGNSGIAKVAHSRSLNHSSSKLIKATGRTVTIFKYGGKICFLAGIGMSAVDIYKADSRAKETVKQIGGWSGAILGGRFGASLGARGGMAAAIAIGQAGPQIASPEELVTVPVFGLIGGVGGGIVGGVFGGVLGVKTTAVAYEWIFTPLEKEEWEVGCEAR